MLNYRASRWIACAGLLVAGSALRGFADDPQPTPVVAPPAATPVELPPADLPPDIAGAPSGTPAPAPSAAASGGTLAPQPEGTISPSPMTLEVPYVSGMAYPVAPVPVVAGNGWQGGWSGAYAPGYYYWSHVPQYQWVTPYVAGYTPGIAPTSWNGYWNYSTAFGAPGYTAYWHGWYAGPYYDSVWPTWSYTGWGYSTIGWGHGHWHRPLVHAPLLHGFHSWR